MTDGLWVFEKRHWVSPLEKAADYGVRRGWGAVVGSRGNKQISEMVRGPWNLG